MMIFIGMLFALLRSYSSGSSNAGYYFYWQVGIILGIAMTLKAKVRESASQDSEPTPVQTADGWKSRAQGALPNKRLVVSSESSALR
jgi:hypothetical protein